MNKPLTKEDFNKEFKASVELRLKDIAWHMESVEKEYLKKKAEAQGAHDQIWTDYVRETEDPTALLNARQMAQMTDLTEGRWRNILSSKKDIVQTNDKGELCLTYADMQAHSFGVQGKPLSPEKREMIEGILAYTSLSAKQIAKDMKVSERTIRRIAYEMQNAPANPAEETDETKP